MSVYHINYDYQVYKDGCGPHGTCKEIFYNDKFLSKDQCRKKLPKVGKVLVKVPNFYQEVGPVRKIALRRPCKVIAVYPETLCYLIEFSTPRGNYREFRRFDD